jgi:hypothetical protein
MRYLSYVTLSLCLLFAGCDVQSGITQKSLEKYQPTPTPERIAQAEEPIDPADVLNIDITAEGPTLSVNTETDKKNLNCDKYNRVTINASGQEVKITGGCSKIVVNGRGNQIAAVGATEIVAYGQNNTIEYSKYVSGKKPLITDSNGTNTITKVSSPSANPKTADTKR